MTMPRSLVRAAPYLAISAVVLCICREVLFDLNDRVLGLLGQKSWLEGTIWWYWDVTNAPLQGINPLANTLQAYPVGFNRILLNGNLGDALLSAPFFWFLPIPAAYNLTIIAFLLFNTTAAYTCFRVWLGGRWIPLCLSLTFLLHPSLLVFIDEGRPTQFLFGWVFLALAWLRGFLQDPPAGRKKWIIASTCGTYICYWYYGFFLSLLLLVIILALGFRSPAVLRKALLSGALKGAAYVVLLCIPFGLPFLWAIFFGEGIEGVSLMGTLLPQAWAKNSVGLFEPLLLHSRFHTYLPYSSLLFIFAAAVVRCYQRGPSAPPFPSARPPQEYLGTFFFCAGIFDILMLGPFLTISGAPVSLPGEHPIWLPWALLFKFLPFFSRLSYPYLAFPFFLVCWLMACGLVLSQVVSHRSRWLGRGAALILLLEVVLRMDPTLPTSSFSVPPFYEQISRDNSFEALIEYPFGATDFRQLYQPIHGKSMFGVEGNEMDVFRWPAIKQNSSQTPLIMKLWRRQRDGHPLTSISSEDVLQARRAGYGYLVVSRQACKRAWRFRKIQYTEIIREFTEALGPPAVNTTRLTAFRLGPAPPATSGH